MIDYAKFSSLYFQFSILLVTHCFIPYMTWKSRRWMCNAVHFREFLLYKFKLGHNATETSKNICCTKGEGAVEHNTVTGWFKKFHSSCKSLDNQTRSIVSKNVDSKAVLQATEANLVSCIQRVSGELDISQFSVVRHLHDLGKSTWSCQIVLQVIKTLTIFDSPLYIVPFCQITVVLHWWQTYKLESHVSLVGPHA